MTFDRTFVPKINEKRLLTNSRHRKAGNRHLQRLNHHAQVGQHCLTPRIVRLKSQP